MKGFGEIKKKYAERRERKKEDTSMKTFCVSGEDESFDAGRKEWH